MLLPVPLSRRLATRTPLGVGISPSAFARDLTTTATANLRRSASKDAKRRENRNDKESHLRGMASAYLRNRSITAYHFTRNAAHVFSSDWRSARMRLSRIFLTSS